MRATGALLVQDTLASSGLLASTRGWSFLPEALLFLVHPLPFVCVEVAMPYYDLRRGDTFTTTLNTDELCAVFMLFARAGLLVRGLPYLCGLASRSSRAYANLNHLNVTTWLSVRGPPRRAPARRAPARRGLARAVPPPRWRGPGGG